MFVKKRYRFRSAYSYLLLSAKKMYKRYTSVVVTLLYTYADYRACHSENQIEPAIRNVEQCEIGCPERCLQPHEVIC